MHNIYEGSFSHSLWSFRKEWSGGLLKHSHPKKASFLLTRFKGGTYLSFLKSTKKHLKMDATWKILSFLSLWMVLGMVSFFTARHRRFKDMNSSIDPPRKISTETSPDSFAGVEPRVRVEVEHQAAGSGRVLGGRFGSAFYSLQPCRKNIWVVVSIFFYFTLILGEMTQFDWYYWDGSTPPTRYDFRWFKPD